jgi:hypothetical protein
MRMKDTRLNNLGAFLHADNEDFELMKVVGSLAELIVQTNPILHRKFIAAKKGRSMLHFKLQQALYRMMKSALLYMKHIKSGKGHDYFSF